MNGRKNLIKRSLNNLIDNALKYAKKINLQLSKKNNSILIIVDDDGPGIPEKEKKMFLNHFIKLIKAEEIQNQVLVLDCLTSDIIKSHGGNILLEKSPAYYIKS